MPKKRLGWLLTILGGFSSIFCISYMTGQMQAYGQSYGIGLEWFSSQYFSPSIILYLLISLVVCVVGVYLKEEI